MQSKMLWMYSVLGPLQGESKYAFGERSILGQATQSQKKHFFAGESRNGRGKILSEMWALSPPSFDHFAEAYRIRLERNFGT